jgi:glycosyltransferase involved in cell wall biosynthesis
MPESQSLVTVIIPAFHAEPFITRALLSVTSQTYQNYEVVIVADEAYFDKTPRICAELLESVGKYYFIVSRQEKTSPANARNLALHHAQGKYVAFLDADDEWRPHHLENAVKTLERNPDVRIYYAKCMNHADGIATDAYGFPVEVINDCCPAPHSTVVIRNPPLFRFDERLRGADDWGFLIDHYRAGERFYFNPEIESYYYVHGGNLTAYSGQWCRQELMVFWYRGPYCKIMSLIPNAVKEWFREKVRGIIG